ncbi:hypothetical protein DdX_06728 [Ditylenchus destructor]|uniref:Uncharacterized protein n=1 Tax=Ditylenchus destructor TaxID=166010 RepID=A0AAD4N7N5_9BILA|nr:hypothetical protein DdX_06728 [Ditylenchus destructor]
MDKANADECQLRREINNLEMRLTAQENDAKTQLRRSKDAEQRLKEVQQALAMSWNENKANQEAANELERQLRHQIEHLVRQIHAMKEYTGKKQYENRLLIDRLQKELIEAAQKLNKGEDLAKSTYISWKRCAAETEKLRQELHLSKRNCEEKEEQCLKYYVELSKYKHELDDSRNHNNELSRKKSELGSQLVDSERQISKLQQKMMQYETEISALKAEKRESIKVKEQIYRLQHNLAESERTIADLEHNKKLETEKNEKLLEELRKELNEAKKATEEATDSRNLVYQALEELRGRITPYLQMQKRRPDESESELNVPKRRCPSTGNVSEVCDTDWDFRDCLGTSTINQNWKNLVLIDSFEESGIYSSGVDCSVERSDLKSPAAIDSTRKQETFQVKTKRAFDSLPLNKIIDTETIREQSLGRIEEHRFAMILRFEMNSDILRNGCAMAESIAYVNRSCQLRSIS